MASRLILQFDGGRQIVNWNSYSFSSDFLTPCDAFTMSVGDSTYADTRSALTAGKKVQLLFESLDSTGSVIDNHPIFTGFIEQVEISNQRGGTNFEVRGRNILGPLCDSQIDPWSPSYKFNEGTTLQTLVGRVFADFGINTFYLTDAKNRLVYSGNDPLHTTIQTTTFTTTIVGGYLTGTPTSEPVTITQTVAYDPTNTYRLDSKQIKKHQPQHGQTYMHFLEEELKRFNLHCWAMSDGSGVVIGRPDYSQSPSCTITNRLDGIGNNVLHSRLHLDFFNMPSAIIARGFHGGGDFANTRIRTSKVNEFIGYLSPTVPLDSVTSAIAKFKGLETIPGNQDLVTNYAPYFSPPPVPRIVYWEDDCSHTLDQLRSAVQRKMSDYQRNGFQLHYTVQDHAQNDIPWKVNTIVTVHDEVLGITDTNFWVLSVHFSKSRSAGTTTDLVLIPVGTLQL